MEYIYSIIYWWSYGVFPFLLWVYLLRRKVHVIVSLISLLLSIVFISSRFIEPQLILTKIHKVDVWFESRIALIADTHIWAYKWKYFLERVVKKLNSMNVDMVLIAGDLTYEPDVYKLESLFSSLWEIEHRAFWVLWNHDVEKPGPPLREELIEALDYPNLVFLNNNIVRYNWIYIVWLWSHWNREDDTSLLESLSPQNDVITLMHNPDSVETFPDWISDIALAGHTHGWQVRLPFLYKKVIPTRWDFDRWLGTHNENKLFITSWLGEVWLPLRFLNPPVIDILELY